MSGRLIRDTVRNMLVAHLGINDRCVRVMDTASSATPEPLPVFVGISPGRWRQWSGFKGGPLLDEEFGIVVTVSVKTGATQPQLYGEKVVQREYPITSCGAGLEALCREIVVFLHDNSEVPCTLDAAIESKQWSGGLWFADGGRPEQKSASWWLSPDDKKTPVGMAQSIEFYGLRRTQPSGETAT